MDPTILGVIGPGFLNQVPTLPLNCPKSQILRKRTLIRFTLNPNSKRNMQETRAKTQNRKPYYFCTGKLRAARMSLVTMGIRLVRLKLQLLGNMTRRQVSPSEFDIGTDGIETQTAFFSKDAPNDFQPPCAEAKR